MQYPTFLEALKQLGPTDKDRAAKLGVTTRTLSKWRKRPPEHIERLMNEPALIDALAIDARSQPAEQNA